MKPRKGQRRFVVVLHDQQLIEAGKRWLEYMDTPPLPGCPKRHHDAPSQAELHEMLKITAEVSGQSMAVMDMVDTGWLRNRFVDLRKKPFFDRDKKRKKPRDEQQEMDL
jgi:hypothetical protein